MITWLTILAVLAGGAATGSSVADRLYAAIIDENVETIRSLIPSEMSVDAKIPLRPGFKKDFEPLWIALTSRKERSSIELIRLGAKVDGIGPGKERNALYSAVSIDLRTVVEYLVGVVGVDADSGSRWGYTPLFEAAFEGHLEIVEYLVNHGADIDAGPVGDYGAPLRWSMKNRRMDVVRYLIDKGARIDFVDRNGATLLWDAARFSVPPAVRLLLDKGLDPNQLGPEGLSPLATVMIRAGDRCRADGMGRIVTLLIEAGADRCHVYNDVKSRPELFPPEGKQYVEDHFRDCERRALDPNEALENGQ